MGLEDTSFNIHTSFFMCVCAYVCVCMCVCVCVCQGVIEEEYSVSSDGTPDPHLIKLFHRLVKLTKPRSASQATPRSIEQCSRSVLVLLHRFVSDDVLQ